MATSGPIRTLATSLDALIQACREGKLDKAFDLSGRVLDLWRRHPRVRLRLEGGLLTADGEVVLGAGAIEGPWLVPAFMAGLREFGIVPHCDESEMLQLAQALAAVQPELETITRLEGWLWADGAEGFAVALGEGPSAGERTALEDPAERLRELSRRRIRASEELGGLAIQAAATVSGIYSAARDELQRPMDCLAREASKGALRQDRETLDNLRATVEDPIFWAQAEMDAALSYEVLRVALPPGRLARRTVALMARSADLKLLGLLEKLAEEANPYARSVKKALEGGSLGAALGREVVLDEEALEKIRAVLDQPELSEVATALITSLLERSVKDRGVAEALLSLTLGAGLDPVWRHVDLGALSADAAQVTCWLLIKVKASTRYLSELVSGLRPEPCMEVMCGLPDASLWPLNPRIRELMGRASGSIRHDLITMLLQREEQRWAKLLGDAFKETRGSGWQERSVKLLAEALCRRKLGRSYIVPMVRDNDVPPEVRVALIDVLQGVATRKALEFAIKFSVKELLYPSEVREAIRTARQRLKTEEDA